MERVGEDADISGSDRVLQLFHCDGSFGYMAGRCMELSLEGREKHAEPTHLKPGCDARLVWVSG